MIVFLFPPKYSNKTYNDFPKVLSTYGIGLTIAYDELVFIPIGSFNILPFQQSFGSSQKLATWALGMSGVRDG